MSGLLAGLTAGANAMSGIAQADAQRDANKKNLQIARETNEMNYKIAQEANANNQQLQKDQNAWNLEQWNRQNDYTSATAQRERLEAAGYNPYLASGQVAVGSASTSSLQSAPYTPSVAPTMQAAHVDPVNYFAGVGNAANDFISTYQNIAMTNAKVKTEEANAQKAQAEASAITGYKRDFTMSEIEKNKASIQLAQTQAEYQETQNRLAVMYGGAEKVAIIENLAASQLESESRRINNGYQAKLLVAQTVKEYAQANNLKVNSNQINLMTDELVKSIRLKNSAQATTNDMLSIDAGIKRAYGRANAGLGYQSLKAQTEITQKDNEFYWWKNAGNTVNSLGNVAKLRGKAK